jgi:lysozyme family protein
LDAAVNHGPGQAIRFVQQVCEAAGFGPLAADGHCGPRTRGAAAEADRIMGDWLLAALVEERRHFYLALVERHPEQRVFLGVAQAPRRVRRGRRQAGGMIALIPMHWRLAP